MCTKGLLIIISGPSGAGKGTVVNRLIQKGDYRLSVSATTREKRPGEEQGVHYYFVDITAFQSMAECGELLEYAEFCGNLYGTPKQAVEALIAEGKTVILEIEVVGALQVKAIYPEAVLFFLTPPTLKELKRRLKKRGTENEERVAMRLKRAEEEIENLNRYDYVVINETVEEAVSDIHMIVQAEKMKAARNLDLTKTIKGDA